MELRGIRFCKDCANILNPLEHTDPDTGEKRLAYSCRVCEYKESARKAEDMLVYHHQIGSKSDYMTKDYKDYPLDISFPRSHENPCPKCHYHESVYFHSEKESGEAGMRLTFVCARRGEDPCGHSWS